MGIWIIVLLWVLLTNFLMKTSSSKAVTINNNYEIIEYSKGFAIVVFIVPFIVVASRIQFVDTDGYISAFKELDPDFSSLSDSNATGYELFRFFQLFVKSFISSNPQIYLAIIALIQTILLIITLRTYSCNFFYSVFLFVASGMMLSWMCNGMRQFLASVILFSFTFLLLKKKWYLYLAVAILLMGFSPIFKFLGITTIPWFLGGIHQSVFIVIIALPFVIGKPLNARIWVLALSVIIVALFGQFNNIIEFFTSNTSYAADMKYVNQDTGLHPLRFLVSLVPVVMVLIRRKEVIKAETPEIIKLSVNMSVISSALYFAAMLTSGTFVGRLPICFELYNLILFPWIIDHLYFDYKRIIMPGFFVMYIAYYIYQLIAWNASSYVISLFGVNICF